MSHNRIGIPTDEDYLRPGSLKRIHQQQHSQPSHLQNEMFPSLSAPRPTYFPQQQPYLSSLVPHINYNNSGYPQSELSSYASINNRDSQFVDQNRYLSRLPLQIPPYNRPSQSIERNRDFLLNAEDSRRFPRLFQQDADYQLPALDIANSRLSSTPGTSGNNNGRLVSGRRHFINNDYTPIGALPSDNIKPRPVENGGSRSLSPLPTPMQLVQQPSYLRRIHENEMRYRSLVEPSDSGHLPGQSRSLVQVSAPDPSFERNHLASPLPLTVHTGGSDVHQVHQQSNFIDLANDSADDGDSVQMIELKENGLDKPVVFAAPSKGKRRYRSKKEVLATYPTLTPSLQITKLLDDGTVGLTDDFVNIEPYKSMDPCVWYLGSAKLETPEDMRFLQPLQVYIRSNLVELFACNGESIPCAKKSGFLAPVALGQVAVRCTFCRNDPYRLPSAMVVLENISSIYSAVQDIFRKHFPRCNRIPDEVRLSAVNLDEVDGAKGGKRKYWLESAKRLGLMDTPHGVHFSRDPTLPILPLGTQRVSGVPLSHRVALEETTARDDTVSILTSLYNKMIRNPVSADHMECAHNCDTSGSERIPELPHQHEVTYPLVTDKDKRLISEDIFFALEHMKPCCFTENDKSGFYKDRQVGFRGLACKYCPGQAGAGRYFPGSEAALSQTTTSASFVNHIRRCRYVPIDVRDKLNTMALQMDSPENSGPKRIRHNLLDRPLHGGRKVFFHRVWCRVQQIPTDDKGDIELAWGVKQSKKVLRPIESGDNGYFEDGFDSDFVQKLDSSDRKLSRKRKELKLSSLKGRQRSGSFDSESVDSSRNGDVGVRYYGCIRLSKGDDHTWLPAQQCFERSSLLYAIAVDEHFVNSSSESLAVYPGQVGIICSFCSNHNLFDRPKGCIVFPPSLSDLPAYLRLLKYHHLVNCTNIPDYLRSSHRSSSDILVAAAADMNQYIIDAARDVGLKDSVNGIYFFREPLIPSPSEAVSSRRKNNYSRSIYVPQSDQSKVILEDDLTFASDHQLLLLDQFKRWQLQPPSSVALTKCGLACKYCETASGRFVAKNFKNFWYSIIQAKKLEFHLSNCSKCPESIKAALAYLSHRIPSNQKLSAKKMKKILFKRIWERTQGDVNSNERKVEDRDEVVDNLSDQADEINDVTIMDNEECENNRNESDGEMSAGMMKMVETAARWLTEFDNPRETASVTYARPHSGQAFKDRNRPPK